ADELDHRGALGLPRVPDQDLVGVVDHVGGGEHDAAADHVPRPVAELHPPPDRVGGDHLDHPARQRYVDHRQPFTCSGVDTTDTGSPEGSTGWPNTTVMVCSSSRRQPPEPPRSRSTTGTRKPARPSALRTAPTWSLIVISRIGNRMSGWAGSCWAASRSARSAWTASARPSPCRLV